MKSGKWAVCGRKVQLSGGCSSGSEQSVCKHGEAAEGISCSWWNGDLARLKGNLLDEGNWKKQMKGTGKKLYRSMLRAVDIPALAADFLQGCMKGQTKINLDLHASDDLAWLMRRLIRNIVLGLWVMALLISSSIICTTDMTPKIMGIPAFGVLGYFGALVILMYLFIKHFMKK